MIAWARPTVTPGANIFWKFNLFSKILKSGDMLYWRTDGTCENYDHSWSDFGPAKWIKNYATR